MVQTGRCRLRVAANDDDFESLEWDDGEPWEFWLEVKTSPGGRSYLLDGSLRRSAAAPVADASDDGEPDDGESDNGEDVEADGDGTSDAASQFAAEENASPPAAADA